jgi:hypothetical protein
MDRGLLHIAQRRRWKRDGWCALEGIRPAEEVAAARAEWPGYQARPFYAEGMASNAFVPRASLRQLVALGFPEPGHPYWHEETRRGVPERDPRLDMAPRREAAAARAEV